MLTHTLPDEHIRKAYGHLRRFAEFHLTDHDFASQEELEAAVNAAQDELLQYAQLAEQDFDPDRPAEERCSSPCRFNLHHLLCALGEQVKHRGLTVEHLELFLEREIGATARPPRTKVTGKPEVLVVQLDLDERALQRVVLELGIESGTEWGTGTSSSGTAGASAPATLVYGGAGSVRNGPAAVGPLGKGTPCTATDWADIEPLARTSMQNNGIWDRVWAASWDEQMRSAQMYKAAILEGGQMATSTRYLRSRSCNGSRVLVAFATPSDNQQLFAAEVLYYVLLQRGSDGGGAGGGGAGSAGAHAGAAGGSGAGGSGAGGGSMGSAGASGPAAEEGELRSGGSGHSAGAPAAAEAATSSCCLAMIRCYNTRVRDEPDLASMLLEAKAGDFVKAAAGHDMLWAVPVPLIIAPLHTHTRRVGSVTMLSFVPVVGRSHRVAFKLM